MYCTTKGVSAQVKIGMMLFKKRIKGFCVKRRAFLSAHGEKFFSAQPSPSDKKGLQVKINTHSPSSW